MVNLVTLLSDFGLSDPYVGVMKGVIVGVNPHLTMIDLTHQIPPQNVALARFALMTAYAYFPAGTVHIAVVDPGVGSDRRAIAIAFGTNPDHPAGFLVGPDNGLFSGVLSQVPMLTAIELTNAQYWRSPALSATFHGRDIFASVGAHLASGMPLSEMGRAIAPTSLIHLDIPAYTQTLAPDDLRLRLTGVIQAIDHFGNLITTIPGSRVLGLQWSVIVKGHPLPGKQTYSQSPPGEALALIGSHGWVEIAVNGGNAQTHLNLRLGASIQIVIDNATV